MKYSLLFIILFYFSCTAPNEPLDLIITNAQIFDGENMLSGLHAVMINHKKISNILPQGDFIATEHPTNNLLDANGNFLMPGLIEGHGHFLSYGEGLAQLDLAPYQTWNDIIQAVEERAKTLPPGTWIEGRGWHQEKWNEPVANSVQGYPHHYQLSQRVPDHPVYLTHASGHAAFANQNAMNLVGISIETKSPHGGRILRDANGRLAGIFEENSMDVLGDFIKKSKDLESIWEDALIRASASCLENGITSFQDAGSSIAQIKWYLNKAKTNQLPLRLNVMAFDSLKNMNSGFPDARIINAGDSFFTCRSVKAYFDGALGSRGAWLLDDYEDQPGYFGQNTMTVEELQPYADICKKHNLQYCVHAIGDRANREVLNLFEKNTSDNNDHRWRVEHAQHIDPADQPRFGKLHVIASMQPIHCTSDAPFVAARLGESRARSGAYVWRNLLNLNAKLAIGTDVPVESINPFENMYAAVSRKSRTDDHAFFEDQTLTRKEILNAYTQGNAYVVFEENFKGKITPNFIADICIVDRNLMTCDEEEISDTQVLYTIINGKIVFNSSK